MTDTKATKPETTASKPAGKPPEPVGVFIKDVYGPFGCFKTGQKLRRSRIGKRWDEWLQARIIKVL